MKSGIRVPYHLEVAEAQRFDEEHKRLRLEQKQKEEEAKAKLIAPEVDQKVLPSSAASFTKEEIGEFLKDQAEQSQKETTTTTTSSSLLSSDAETTLKDKIVADDGKKKTAAQIFEQTEAYPSSLTDFENLKNMPEVVRYDAFYKAPSVPLKAFKFRSRWKYLNMFYEDAINLHQFLSVDEDQATVVAHVYRHEPSGTLVTLLPVVHVAHPEFWRMSDELCRQHHSVLMEGRFSPTSTDISVVPPRDKLETGRPEDEMDSEGWEPSAGNHMQNFRQPYSWGVNGSKEHTIIHAADVYDYDKLPAWARIRWNLPFLGNYKREKHCLNVLHQLTENGYESFVIPWGAAHMPTFAKMLRQNDFTHSGTTRLALFNRVDGPVSAAYCRKLGSMLWWSNSLSMVIRTLGSCAFIGLFFLYLDYHTDDIVDFRDNTDKGYDDPARRTMDRAMTSKHAERLRQGR